MSDTAPQPIIQSSAADPFVASTHEFGADIDLIQTNPAVQTMLETVCMATGVRFAAVARVTPDRWVTCSTVDRLDFGLKPGDELDVQTTLCHEVREFQSEIIIDDVSADETYCGHHTPRIYGFRSYLSIPIHRPDGRFFGTLCALDPEPFQLSDARVVGMVRLFAKLIGDAIGTGEALQEVRDDLQHERELADIQEQFLAMLTHDLRNPISALTAGLRMLQRTALDERARTLVGLMDGSVQRMHDLVENLMDHARKRLGGGIVLNRNADAPLGDTLQQIISEFRTVSPDQAIVAEIDLPDPIECDRARIAQLLSNLLGNAVTHGADGKAISVGAKVHLGTLELSVRNTGAPISPIDLPTLFQPFHKGGDRGGGGLGLGLYIASEIAKAHGGEIVVASDDEATVFTFRMPLAA